MRLSLYRYVTEWNPHIPDVVMSFSARAIEAYNVFFIFLYHTEVCY